MRLLTRSGSLPGLYLEAVKVVVMAIFVFCLFLLLFGFRKNSL